METVHNQDAIAIALRREVPALPGDVGSSMVWPAFERYRASDGALPATPRPVQPGSRISSERLCQILVDCGLMTSASVTNFLESFPSDAKPEDGTALANALVQAERLTTFQADAVLAGKGKSLQLGNYIVLDKIGQGGMGVVFKALHRRLNRVVALKVLAPRFTARPEFVQRFQREVHAAAKLSHPHIVKALDAELTGSKRFLVMEYVAGTDLSSLVKQRGRLPLRLAIDAVLQAARGLEFAHAQGIVHRDVKPSNLLRNSTGTIKLLDLGLARMASADSGVWDLTTTGTVMGTADYMAPEQAADTKHADARADVYSLGITLCYLLTGRVAYEGGSAMSKLLAHRETPIPSLTAALASIPPEVDRVFHKMVAKRPDERYSSMTEVIVELERCLSHAPVTAEDSSFFERTVVEDSCVACDATRPMSEENDGESQSHVSTLSMRNFAENDTLPPGMLASPAKDAENFALPSPEQARSRRVRRGLVAFGAMAIATAGIWLARDRIKNSATKVDTNVADTSSAGIATSKQVGNQPRLVGAPPQGLTNVLRPPAKPSATESPPSPPAQEDVPTARKRLAELDKEVEANPEAVGAHNERSLWHKRLGMWREAIVDVERMADMAPEQSIVRTQAAYIGVLAGDLDTYRRTCRYLIDHFGQSNNVDDLERACKAPLYVVGEFPLSSLPIKRFEELITVDVPDHGPMYWACVTRAFVACHENQPQAALDWLAKRVPPPTAIHLHTYSQFVRAQALHKLGRHDEARAAFDDAVARMPVDLVQHLDGTLDSEVLLKADSVHGDWLILSIVRRQTQELLENPS
jgi:serine/threonine protein kinase